MLPFPMETKTHGENGKRTGLETFGSYFWKVFVTSERKKVDSSLTLWRSRLEEVKGDALSAESKLCDILHNAEVMRFVCEELFQVSRLSAFKCVVPCVVLS